MGIGHQRPEEGRRGQGGRALRPIRNIMKSSKPHHPMRGRLFNMLRKPTVTGTMKIVS